MEARASGDARASRPRGPDARATSATRAASPTLRALAAAAFALATAAAAGPALAEGGDVETSPPPSVAARIERVEPGALLPGLRTDVPMDADTARGALRSVRSLRPEVEDALVREKIACYRRFLVNGCLADVARRERLAGDRLDGIEVAANQALREEAALELNRRAAEALARRDADADAEAARREENRRTFEARRAATAAETAARERDAAALAAREAANRGERERRRAENAARREEAARRAREDAPNAAARAREIEENRRLAAERAEREREAARERREAAERRAAEQAEAERRRQERGPRAGPGTAPAAPAAPPR
ncbi:MAG TPA: hypothetical protein VEA81_18870 [Burkholderiaceae bacterium]|nr:hypothetical protein [Burkholderiaceae bacterium]